MKNGEWRIAIGRVLAGGVAVAMATSLAAASKPVEIAREQIQKLIAASGAETVAVAWRRVDPKSNDTILINAKVRFHAASTMKLPVMIELFREADRRKL